VVIYVLVLEGRRSLQYEVRRSPRHTPSVSLYYLQQTTMSWELTSTQ
jgi:hypothetical protein